MIPIDKLFIEMTVTDYEITEGTLYGLLNGNAIKLGKEVLSFPFKEEDEYTNQSYESYENNQGEELSNEDEKLEVIHLYSKHMTEARAEAMLQILIDFEHEYIGVIDSCDLSFEDNYTRYSSYTYSSKEDSYRVLAIHFLNREKLENSMKTLDIKAFSKAKKMFWEKINDSQNSQNIDPEDLQNKETNIPSIL